MAAGNYLRRVEALEQQAAPKSEWWRNVVRVTLTDGDTQYGGEVQTLVREEGESWPELERRGRSAWGLTDKYLICRHYVASNGNGGLRFAGAEYEAIGCRAAKNG